jgi:hypothetical protein
MSLVRGVALLLFFCSLPASAADLSVRLFRRSSGTGTLLNVENSGPDAAIAPRLRVTTSPVLPLSSFLGSPDSGWPACTRSEGAIDCTRETFDAGVQQLLLLGHPVDPPGRYTISVDVSASNDSNPSNDHAEITLTFGHSWTIQSDGDSGPGSLRAALEEANALCDGAVPCDIAFFDHPEILPKAIFLRSPLPAITACALTISSARRPPDLPDFTWGITGGELAAGEGLVFRPRCEGTTIGIDGFAVSGFPGDGIAILGPAHATYTFSRLSVSGHSRGIAVEAPNAQLTVRHSTFGNTGRSAITLWSAQRTAIENVRIGVTEVGSTLPVGASGIFVGPTGGDLTVRDSLLASARDFGIALARGNATVTLSNAFMTANRAGDIDWGLDGPTPNVADDAIPDTSRILSATYDDARNVTRIAIDPQGTTGRIEAWAARSLTLFLNAHLEQFVGVADANGIVEFAGDLRGRYVSALRVEEGRVSEVSFAMRVQ